MRKPRMGLARISVVRGDGPRAGTPAIDDYIRSLEAITDHLTKFSGLVSRCSAHHVSVCCQYLDPALECRGLTWLRWPLAPDRARPQSVSTSMAAALGHAESRGHEVQATPSPAML